MVAPRDSSHDRAAVNAGSSDDPIYIAGSSRELARVESCIALARSRGITITFDWPAHVRANPGGANVGSAETLSAAAHLCLQGAIEARVVWALIPEASAPSAGMWWECGAADALGVKVIASRPPPPTSGPLAMLREMPRAQFCIFEHLRGVTVFDTDAAAFEAICGFLESEAAR